MSEKAKECFWDIFVVKSWWIYLICVFSFFLFDHFSSKKKVEISNLETKQLFLERQRDLSLLKKEDLHVRICSQSDPSWIEIVLMKQLGLVPDGYMKIHFKKE